MRLRVGGFVLWLLLACGSEEAPSEPADECASEEPDAFDNSSLGDAPQCQPPEPQQQPDCEAEPTARGCPCLTGERRDCYSGPDDTIDVGMCRIGEQDCFSGRWGSCRGEVAPGPERCNDRDDDCDGVIDEGARSPCGGCNSECVGAVWGSLAQPFEEARGLRLTERGELTLARLTRETESVWVPNSGEATVSKIDPDSAREVARYRTAQQPGRLTPERVAVDYRGDAWVLSSAAQGRSRLVKLAGDSERCVDRDGDGLLTSQGPEQVLSFGQDDCVLLDTAVGRDAGMARALAVGGSLNLDGELGGDVWVGMQHEARLLQLDGQSGEVLQAIDTPDFAPYAAVFDPWGTLWVIDQAGLLARVQPWNEAQRVEIIEANLACYALESLASDERGVLTLTGFACENVVRYDPGRRRFQQVAAPGVLSTRGVTVLGQDSWVVHTSGQISRVSSEPFEFVATYSLHSGGLMPIESIGIGADSQQRLWVISSMGGAGGVGLATRFSLDDNEVSAQVPLGFLPRGQGDITGGRVSSRPVPEAAATRVFRGCDSTQDEAADASTQWRRVHISWLPAFGSQLQVEARHAATIDALADAAFVELGTLPADEPPFALDFPPGGRVELRLSLRATGSGAPRISEVGLQWRCPGPD